MQPAAQPFYLAAEFWIAVAGIVATAVAGLGAQVAQSRRHRQELVQARRRHKYEELRDHYLRWIDLVEMFDTLGLQYAEWEQPEEHGRRVKRLVEDIFVLDQQLTVVGASQAVEQATSSFLNLGTRLWKELDDETDHDAIENTKAELHKAKQVLAKACRDHLKSVWPEGAGI